MGEGGLGGGGVWKGGAGLSETLLSRVDFTTFWVGCGVYVVGGRRNQQ